MEEATHEKKPQNRKPPQKHLVNQFDFDESEEEILSISCTEEQINTVDNHTNKILAFMKIGGKEVKMLIDSGASCNVLTIKYFPQRNCGWKIESHPQDVLKVNQPLVKQKSPWLILRTWKAIWLTSPLLMAILLHYSV